MMKSIIIDYNLVFTIQNNKNKSIKNVTVLIWLYILYKYLHYYLLLLYWEDLIE